MSTFPDNLFAAVKRKSSPEVLRFLYLFFQKMNAGILMRVCAEVKFNNDD
ncbi:hypothetical protein [Pedobacter sp. NJ-S-72]